MSNPFIAGPIMKEAAAFIGRTEQLKFITDRMTGAQPISINVHGERRIGKSSLLYHFYLTWEQRVKPKERDQFVVVYLSLENAQCRQEADFYKQVATKLCERSQVKNKPALQQPWQKTSWTRTDFNQALDAWKMQGVLPVLCVDEIEQALQNKQAFNKGFYSNLRSLMGHCVLMLVVASLQPLSKYEKYGLSPEFFNHGHCLPLTGFTDAEVTELLTLPTRPNRKKVAPVLGMRERELARRWDGKHPCQLQIAGHCLYEATQQGKDEQWARQRFEHIWKGMTHRRSLIPSWVTAIPKWLLTTWHVIIKSILIAGDVRTILGGITSILVIILWLFGWLDYHRLVEIAKTIFSF
jgi:hypothetical protein